MLKLVNFVRKFHRCPPIVHRFWESPSFRPTLIKQCSVVSREHWGLRRPHYGCSTMMNDNDIYLSNGSTFSSVTFCLHVTSVVLWHRYQSTFWLIALKLYFSANCDDADCLQCADSKVCQRWEFIHNVVTPINVDVKNGFLFQNYLRRSSVFLCQSASLLIVYGHHILKIIHRLLLMISDLQNSWFYSTPCPWSKQSPNISDV